MPKSEHTPRDPTKNDLNIGHKAGQRDSEAVKLLREIAQAWEGPGNPSGWEALAKTLDRAVEFARRDKNDA